MTGIECIIDTDRPYAIVSGWESKLNCAIIEFQILINDCVSVD